MADISKIVNSEYEILKALWLENPLTANELFEKLSISKKWSKSTVITLVNRLVEKGAVEAEKRGVYFYSPIVTESEYIAYHTKHFLGKHFGGQPKNLLAYFYDQHNITAQDIDELKKMIEEEGQ